MLFRASGRSKSRFILTCPLRCQLWPVAPSVVSTRSLGWILALNITTLTYNPVRHLLHAGTEISEPRWPILEPKVALGDRFRASRPNERACEDPRRWVWWDDIGDVGPEDLFCHLNFCCWTPIFVVWASACLSAFSWIRQTPWPCGSPPWVLLNCMVMTSIKVEAFTAVDRSDRLRTFTNAHHD